MPFVAELQGRRNCSDSRPPPYHERCTMQPWKSALTVLMVACPPECRHSQAVPEPFACLPKDRRNQSVSHGVWAHVPKILLHLCNSRDAASTALHNFYIGSFQRSSCRAASKASPAMNSCQSLLPALSHDTSFASPHFLWSYQASAETWLPWHHRDLVRVALVGVGGCAARSHSTCLSKFTGFTVGGELGRLAAAEAHAHGLTVRSCSCEADFQVARPAQPLPGPHTSLA